MWSRKPTPVSRVARAVAVERRATAGRRSPGLAVDLGGAASSAWHSPDARLHRLGVPLEALGARRSAPPARGQRAGGVADPAPRSCAGGSARGESPEAKRAAPPVGSDVVGARDVVAERGRRRSRPTNRQPGAAHPRRQRLGVGADELEVLGRERLGERERLRGVRDVDEPRRSRRCPGVRRGARRARRAAPRSATTATTSVPAPCSACASRSSADGSASAPAVGDHEQVARAREAVDPDVARTPGAWPPARTGCPGPTITSTRGDGLGAVGERGDRLRAAHRGRPRRRPHSAQAARIDRVDSPAPAARTRRPRRRPAARAVTTPITTVLGYGARPPGT